MHYGALISSTCKIASEPYWMKVAPMNGQLEDEEFGSSAGEDPLVDDQTDHDINSVAGVLKLYFRGLENPLFPKERFLDFISTTS